MFPNLNLFGRSFDSYALIAGIALLVTFLAAILTRPRELPPKQVAMATFLVIISSVLGALALYILLHDLSAIMDGHMSFVNIIKDAGVAYLGGPILSLIVLWILCRIYGTPFLIYADFAAPLFMLERAIGRIGCLAYGCCYGIESHLPWAYTFRCWGITNFVPRHPTQAYAIISALAIFIASLYLAKKTRAIRGLSNTDQDLPGDQLGIKENFKRNNSKGLVFFFVILAYSILRFFNEFLRAEGPYLIGRIKASHLLLACFVLISSLGLFSVYKSAADKELLRKSLSHSVLVLIATLILLSAIVLSILSIF